MSRALVIAEKPSVAADIARALGKFKKQKDFFENDDYVISSAIGHLVEIAAPENEEVKRGKWSLKNLPVIPSHFVLKPIEKTEARFKLLKKLIAQKDIAFLINACDAGREGELIFRHIVRLAGAKKPIKRLWLQSMTPASIREHFEKLREGKEFEPLASAAMCRSEADWLVGINGTRALTAFNSLGGGFNKTTVGRVQTPTLAVLVEREEVIRKFEPKNYWEVYANFGAKAGDYEGRWFEEKFKKSEDEKDRKAERLWEKKIAEKIVAECQGKTGIVEEESKPSSQLSPLLYDLTSLQREGNSRFGFSARTTLSIAQALYEKHKLITYPRTDSRYLPEDYPNTVRKTLEELKGFESFAQKILKSDWVKLNKRIFNQAKVSDHFAIIPTLHQANVSKLNDVEKKIYDAIVRRFLAVFYPPAIYEVTTRITRIEKHAFKTEGKVLKDPGWLAVYGKDEKLTSDDNASLVPIENKEKVNTKSVETRESATKPPPRFTEATLLSAMEGAGKLVDDEELRQAMAAKGLGTPATRAAIIEGLIAEKYIARDGRELVPSAKAFHLLETLKHMQIPELSSPELTGEWEYKLKLIEKSELDRPAFMAEIQEMARDVVKKVKGFSPDQVQSHPVDLKDPFTGQQMEETLRDYRTPDESLVIRKVIASRVMELDEIRELLEKRVIGPLDGFRSKLGRPFSALLRLKDDKQVVLDWGNENGNGQPVDFSKAECIGVCPKDGAKVFDTPLIYMCENTATKKCDFRFSKKILNQEISREQAVKLLTNKKTDLLTAFVSQKTKRPFKAFLVLKPDGKIGFEFLPKEAKPKKTSSVAAKAKTKNAE